MHRLILFWYKYTCRYWKECTQATFDMLPSFYCGREKCPVKETDVVTKAYRTTILKAKGKKNDRFNNLKANNLQDVS